MIYILIFFIVIIVMLIPITNSQQKRGIKVATTAIYLGGFPDIQAGSKVTFMIQNDTVTIQKGFSTTKEFHKCDLINAEIMSESKITQDVSLGRLLVFGMFAFGMKKNKVINQNYLVLTYRDNNNEDRQIILKPTENLERLTKNIREYIGVA